MATMSSSNCGDHCLFNFTREKTETQTDNFDRIEDVQTTSCKQQVWPGIPDISLCCFFQGEKSLTCLKETNV